MRGYRIINSDAGYYFELIPYNNNAQPIGRSKLYSSEMDCEQGVQDLRSLIILNHVDSIQSPYIRIEKNTTRCCVGYLLNGEIVFSSRNYDGMTYSNSKASAVGIIQSIFDHVDEYFSYKHKMVRL